MIGVSRLTRRLTLYGERELIKLRSLASAIADALRRRGIPEPAASLTAEAGIAILKVAYERWIDDTKLRGLSHHIRESLDELKALAAGTSTATSPTKGTRRKPPKSELRRQVRA